MPMHLYSYWLNCTNIYLDYPNLRYVGAVLSQMLCLSNDTNSKVGDSKKGGGWMVSRAHSVSYSKSSSDY